MIKGFLKRIKGFIPGVKTLKVKLLLSYMVIVIIPIIFMGMYSLDRISSYITQQKVEAEERALIQLKGNIENLLSSYVDISQQIFFNNQIAMYFMKEHSDPEESLREYYNLIFPLFSGYKLRRSEVVSITVYTENETIQENGIDIVHLKEDMPQWRMYQKAMEAGGLIVWELNEGQVNRPYDWLLYRRLSSVNPDEGMLVMRILGSKFQGFMEGELDGNELYIIAPDGTVMASTKEEAIARNVADLPFKDAIFSEEPGARDGLGDGERLKVITTKIKLSAFSPGEWTLVKTFPVRRISRDVYQSIQYELAAFLAVLIFAGVMSVVFSEGIGRRIRLLSTKMKRVQEGDFNTRVPVSGDDEIGQLQASFNTMVDKLNELVNQVYQMEMQKKDMEIKRREAELYALQSQINPHFLFNTLEAILMGLEENNKETGHIIQLLAKSFRRNIQWKDEYVPLQEELNFVLEYLTIQKFRMQDKLNWSIDIPQDLMDVRIPKLMIQPIVENAVVHGVAMKKGDGTVRIEGRRIDDSLHLTIQDDGVGFSPEELDRIRASLHEKTINTTGKRIGLKNVHDRIMLYYGGRGKLRIDSLQGEGTTVQIIIPL